LPSPAASQPPAQARPGSSAACSPQPPAISHHLSAMLEI
jgi:hypothetical protein